MANWPNNKHIECNVNNDVPVRIPSFPFVLLNQSVLCNCEIKAENHFLLKLLAAFQDTKSKLIMYFTVNTAFINYFDNLNDSLKFQFAKLDYTQTDHTYFFTSFDFDCGLLKAPKTLKDFVYQFQHKKEIFDFQKWHNNNDLELATKMPFLISTL